MCFHALYHGSCSKKDCYSGRRKQVMHVLSCAIYVLWSTIEKVLSAEKKIQIVRIKSIEENYKMIGIEIPNTNLEHLRKVLEEDDRNSRYGEIEMEQIENEALSESDLTDSEDHLLSI